MYSTRTLYIAFLSVIFVLVFPFAGSLVFFHQSSHRAYHYDIRQNNRSIGTVKVDRFATDDRTVYKQSADMLTNPVYSSERARLAFDKKGVSESFFDERITREGTTSLFCVESLGDRLSFLSRFQSSIAYIDNIPARKDIFIFRADMPVTYLPIIEKYDFRKGRSRSFPALAYESHILPPAKRQVTLTSIRDEYLKIEGRKIKTELLILKIRGYPQGSIWVAKYDRKIIAIELPVRKMRIVRTFAGKKAPMAAELATQASGTGQESQSDTTASREAVIKSGNILLAGTLSYPLSPGKHPSVLLVPAEGPYNRDYMGFFTAIAKRLSERGFTVLRYDRRGTGKSAGDPDWPRSNETVEDICAALRHLSEQPEADPARIALITHADGAGAAAKAMQTEKTAGAIVFISPDIYTITDYARNADLLDEIACRKGWDKEYREMILMASRDTRERVDKAKLNWDYILGKRCFLAEIKERMAADPLEPFKTLAARVLIIQGQEDGECTGESASSLKTALGSQGTAAINLVYFDGLDRFLGAPMNNGARKTNYEPSEDVQEALCSWLTSALPEREPKAPAASVSETEKAPQAAGPSGAPPQ